MIQQNQDFMHCQIMQKREHEKISTAVKRKYTIGTLMKKLET